MDELYIYMREKLAEMHKNRSSTVEIDCVEFMHMMKMLCYLRQIRTIAMDE